MTRTEWLKNLASGTRVAVVDASNGEPSDRIIHYGTVRRTPSGRCYLQDPFGGRDWRKGIRNDPGAGRRAIVPVGVDGKIVKLEE